MRRVLLRLSLCVSVASLLAGCSHLTGMAAVSPEIRKKAGDKECHQVAAELRMTSLFGGPNVGSVPVREDRIFPIRDMLEDSVGTRHCNIERFTVSAHAEGSFRPVYNAAVPGPRQRLTQEEAHFIQVIENMMTHYNSGYLKSRSPNAEGSVQEPFRILVFAHGGLVSHANSIERAQLLAPAMIADGYFPLFVTWNSPFPQAYFQRLCCLSDGSPSTSLSSVMLPFRLVGDIGSGVARIPENTIEQSGRFLSSRQATREPDPQELESGDLSQSERVDRNAWLAEEQYRIWPSRTAREGPQYRCTPYLLRRDLVEGADGGGASNAGQRVTNRGCPNVVLPPYRQSVDGPGDDAEMRAMALDDLNGRRSELSARLGNVAMVPIRTVVSGVAGAGASSWDGMVRRARLGFSREFVVHYQFDRLAEIQAIHKSNLHQAQSIQQEPLDAAQRTAVAQTTCGQILRRKTSPGSTSMDPGSYYSDSTPGTHYRFFERLSHCIRMGAFGDKVQVNVFGHSMGAIVANELIDKIRTIPYNNVVFMGAAASIRDTASTINILQPIYNQTKGERPRFFNLMLHPISESIETSEGLSWQSLTPRGSLLEWIDEMFEGPRDVSERTVGKWRNIREGSQVFRADSMMTGMELIRMRVFPVTYSGRGGDFSNFLGCWPYAGVNYTAGEEQPVKCTPERHGEFSDYSFWRAPFYTGNAPESSRPVGTWTENRNFSTAAPQ